MIDFKAEILRDLAWFQAYCLRIFGRGIFILENCAVRVNDGERVARLELQRLAFDHSIEISATLF